MDYPAQYKTHVLQAIQTIDLGKVSQVIQIFQSARAHGTRIFVCGNGAAATMASQLLCDIVKGASFNRMSRFRILALSDQLPTIGGTQDDLSKDRVFVEQLKNFAEPEDVVMGISTLGNSATVINAIEYADWIGCKTIGLTGYDGGRIAQLVDLSVQIPVRHMGSVEDMHVMICHMIGYYFVESPEP